MTASQRQLPRHAPPDLLPLLDAPAGVVQYLAYEAGEPLAFVQAYRVMAHQAEGWWPDETDPQALGVDQFIGLAERLGQGLGTRMLRRTNGRSPATARWASGTSAWSRRSTAQRS